MRLLWRSPGGLLPREIRARLRPDHAVAHTTVVTVVTRLWKKGLLSREAEGTTFRYRPTESQEQHGARRMQEILDAASDRALTLSRFVGSLSKEDLDALRRDLP